MTKPLEQAPLHQVEQIFLECLLCARHDKIVSKKFVNLPHFRIISTAEKGFHLNTGFK